MTKPLKLEAFCKLMEKLGIYDMSIIDRCISFFFFFNVYKLNIVCHKVQFNGVIINIYQSLTYG